MVSEKQAAFSEAWTAMAIQTALANQALAASMVRALYSMWFAAKAPKRVSTAKLFQYGARVLNAGLSPVHRTATANVKRLRRIKRRAI